MSFRITCYTLFDITQTGVMNRSRAGDDEEVTTWLHSRNTQCNFDTVLQSISLRSQPEVVNYPVRTEITFDNFTEFGFLFTQQAEEVYSCWSFDFDVHHTGVFDNGITELGALYSDCDMVPMIKCGTEWDKLPAFLDTSDELRNIDFKVTENG